MDPFPWSLAGLPKTFQSLLKKRRAAILNVTSGLAFIPSALTPTYSATKAALHSYTQSLRYQLRGTAVQVIEIIPPHVQTALQRGRGFDSGDPRAMPLDEYIAETISCAYLAGVTLAGLGVSMLTSWWWVQYVAALALLVWLVPEAREALDARSHNWRD